MTPVARFGEEDSVVPADKNRIDSCQGGSSRCYRRSAARHDCGWHVMDKVLDTEGSSQVFCGGGPFC